ncbi:MAG: hypothetical protein HUJ25_13665 [Crocinitomicaceae bacterium]|nr:hypothetical protein [Crocinitomicaceae bacterium]
MKVLILIAAFLVPFAILAKKKSDVEYKEVEMFEGNVQLKVPSAFQLLPETQLSKYYEGQPKTKVAYVNDEKSIRIGFGSESLLVDDRSLPAVTNLIEKWLKNKHPKTKWKTKEVTEVDGHKVGYIEFIKKKPEKYYEMVFFTLYRGQMLHCTFHAPKKGYKPWKTVSHEIMQSLKLRMPEKE